MKKLLLALTMLLTIGSVACADEYAHNDNVLPVAAKTVIKKNFKAAVSLVKIDKDFGRVSDYEVILDDGSEITFDADGNWKEVETNVSKSVPSGFLPKGVIDFVNKNHKGQHVIGIEKKRNGYDVELSNGIDLKFDKTGAFNKYD